MENDKELAIELAKNKADAYVALKELNTSKQNFIEEINNGLGEEIKGFIDSGCNKPVKIKKPFSLKLSEFFDKIKTVIGL